jgi:short-subunit dehydrogenase
MSIPARPAIVITGASSGIGAELARHAPFPYHTLVLVARSEFALRALADEIRAGGRLVEVVVLDLGDSGAGARLASVLAQHELDCSILVNNAGFGLNGAVADLALDAQLNLIRLNVRALTDLTLRFLPGMLARRTGGILNIASVASFMPGPSMAAYYASKAYVRSFSEALWQEVKGNGVTVTCLAPGPVATPFLARSGVGGTRLFKVLPKATPAAVARAGWAAFIRGRRLAIPGFLSKLNALGGHFLPRALTLRFIAATQKPPRRHS